MTIYQVMMNKFNKFTVLFMKKQVFYEFIYIFSNHLVKNGICRSLNWNKLTHPCHPSHGKRCNHGHRHAPWQC